VGKNYKDYDILKGCKAVGMVLQPNFKKNKVLNKNRIK